MKTASIRLLGSVFDQLYKETQVLYACNFRCFHEEIETMRILLPDLIEHEKTFDLIMTRISRLRIQSGGAIEIYTGGEISKKYNLNSQGEKKVEDSGKSPNGFIS
jgi:hypothetical protein